MRHLGAALLAAGALALVAGCGSQVVESAISASSTLSIAPTSGGPFMGGPKLPAGTTPVSGSRVNVTELPAGFPREVWTTGDGATLGLYGEQGGCDTISAQVVAQTSTQVTVRLLQIQQKPAGRMAGCPMYEMVKPLSVTLAQPLGNRTVLLQLSIQEG